MPKAVEKCVSSLMAKWAKDPSSRPPPRKKGKDGKSQDAKSQAWAICTASYQKSHGKALEIMLEGGYGPTFIGAAATNRPYIPKLEESRMEEVDGEQKIIVHLANPGFFNHPTGPFVLNRAIFSNMINNFETVVLGQKSAYDSRHKPELGALGWFEKLWVDEQGKFWGQVDPTTAGKDLIGGKSYLYSSMEFHRNYQRDDVKLDLEDATEDFCVLNLEDEYEVQLEELGYTLEGEGSEHLKKALNAFLKSKFKVLDLGEHDGEAPPGLVKIDGKLYIGKDAARAYLDALAGGEAELNDVDDIEIVSLFNPFHDPDDGKFTTKQGGKTDGKKPSKTKAVLKGGAAGTGGFIIGGVTGAVIGQAISGASGRTWTPLAAGGQMLGGAIGAVYLARRVRDKYRADVKAWEDQTREDVKTAKMEGEFDSELITLEQADDIRAIKDILEKFLSGSKPAISFGKVENAEGLPIVDGELVFDRKLAKIVLDRINKNYQLFNPFHDPDSGKFTTKEGGKSYGGIVREKVGNIGKKYVESRASSYENYAKGLRGQKGKWERVKHIVGDTWVQAMFAVGVAASFVAYSKWLEKRYYGLSEDDSMNDEERIQLELELEEEREKRQEEQERIKALEKERDTAMDKALKLEQEAMDSAVASVVNLAVNHRDKNGMALPRVFAEWVKKVLSFDEFGEDGNVVKLEQEERPGAEVVRYLTGAIQSLVLEMPGTIPAERITQSGKGQSDEDDFEYAELWADKKKGD